MSQNLKIRGSPKAGYSHKEKVFKNIVEHMLLGKIYVTWQLSRQIFLSFGLSSWRLCFRVDFVSFSLCLLFHFSLVLKQFISFRKIKFGGEILNWVSNLNVENMYFSHYLKAYLSFFCLQSLEKIRFNFHRVGCLIRQISPIISRY